MYWLTYKMTIIIQEDNRRKIIHGVTLYLDFASQVSYINRNKNTKGKFSCVTPISISIDNVHK